MDFLSFLANLLLSVTVGTLTVALIAYLAHGLREKRKPLSKKAALSTEDSVPVFLRRYLPDSDRRPANLAETRDTPSGKE
jgi:hypothetical protein